jgi:hypothetical protein
LSPKYRLALRLKNGKPHPISLCPKPKDRFGLLFPSSELLENYSFSDRADDRITLPISNLLLLLVWIGPLPSELDLRSSVRFRNPRGKPLARSVDGIPQSYLAIRKDVHGPSLARHRDIMETSSSSSIAWMACGGNRVSVSVHKNT